MKTTPSGGSRLGGLRGGLMVCGTTSDAGKSTVVAGLCRLLARQGVNVAPFKAQNMSLNSVVTPAGHEIGRAQGHQAFAAGVAPDVAMNPILLKPTGERSSQVVVMGEPWRTMSAADYHDAKPELLGLVLDALATLRARHDVVLCEGAGSPTEINLLDRDIVNLRVADEARIPALLVGDINPGGVFASLYGTVALLPDHLRRWVRGLVINKLRGDPALLLDGTDQLQELLGVPTLGVIPWIESTMLDAEDSLALDRAGQPVGGDALADELDVAVIRFPRISNFTDVDPLLLEPGVRVRYVTARSGLGRPDLLVLPGSKATVSDLAWLRSTGLADAVAATDAFVLGICGGYQILGHSIDDDTSVESIDGSARGLGLLDVTTEFHPVKVTRQREGHAMGQPIAGYQIHHGRVRPRSGEPFVALSTESGAEVDGIECGPVAGTTLHGVLDRDEFRSAFLTRVAAHRGKRFVPAGVSFAGAREAAVDRLADVLETHLDVDRVVDLIASAATH